MSDEISEQLHNHSYRKLSNSVFDKPSGQSRMSHRYSTMGRASVCRVQTLDGINFEQVLRRGLNDDSITGVTIKDKRPAVGKGENFLSELWRFTLEYYCCQANRIFPVRTKRQIKLVVKLVPTKMNPGTKLIIEQNIFDTELKMFKTILPETESFVGKRLSPKFFYGTERIIVMEDLAVLGFKTKDRQRGLSMDHVTLVLESIAKFHAASVYQCEQNPNVVKSFTVGIMSRKTPKNMFRIFEQTLQNICDNIRRWPDPIYSAIADKLVVMKHKFAEEILRVTDYDETEFCVLNHGDCWINNIMFREDDRGKPEEVVLVDYQMSVYSSPTIDLVYFLCVCPEVNLHTSKNDYFVGKYLKMLKETMTHLGCRTQPPTFAELQRAMLKRRMWAVFAGLMLHPRMISDISEVESFDQLLKTGITSMNIFKNPTATTFLRKFLSDMNDRGYFD